MSEADSNECTGEYLLVPQGGEVAFDKTAPAL